MKMKQRTKRRIFKYVIRNTRCKSIRKFINWKRIERAGSGNNKGKGIERAGSSRPLSSSSQKQLDF